MPDPGRWRVSEIAPGGERYVRCIENEAVLVGGHV